VGAELLGDREERARLLVPSPGPLLGLVARARDGLQIREDELRLDCLDVPHGIEPAGDVHHVPTLKAPDDLDDRVHFADVLQKLVPQTFAAGRTADEARDVHELNGRRDDPGSLRDLRERLEAGVGHRHDADVRLDRAERIVGGLGLAGAREGVEERRFADVREPDDPRAKHRGSL
jgi:hypothetical protein